MKILRNNKSIIIMVFIAVVFFCLARGLSVNAADSSTSATPTPSPSASSGSSSASATPTTSSSPSPTPSGTLVGIYSNELGKDRDFEKTIGFSSQERGIERYAIKPTPSGTVIPSPSVTASPKNNPSPSPKSQPSPSPKKDYSNVKLNAKKIIMKPGKEYTLKVSGIDIDDINWYSTNSNVASIYEGTITSKNTGNATIKAILPDGSIRRCRVTVSTQRR